MGGQDVGLPPRAHRRRRRGSSARISRWRASSAGCCSSRTSARSTPAGIPHRSDGSTRSHTAGLDATLATSQLPRLQNLRDTAWLLHADQPGVSSGNNAFGGSVDYPNDRWNVAVRRDRGAGELRPGRRLRDPPQLSAVPADGLTFAPRPANNRYVRQYRSATRSWTCRPISTTTCSTRRRT